MFLEINDISTGSVITEPLNMYTVSSVYEKPVGSKYRVIYRLTNGIIKEEEFDTKSDADSRIDEVKEISGGGTSTNVYTYKGSCLFANKPSSGQVAGDVWNIEDDFTLDGKNYPAGTNIAWDGTGWDPLAGSMVAGGLTYNGVIPTTAVTTDNAVNIALLDTGIYYAKYYVRYSTVNNPTSSQRINFSDYSCRLTSYELIVFKKYSDAAVSEVFAYAYGVSYTSIGLCTQFVSFTKTNGTVGLSITVTDAQNPITSSLATIDTAQTISGKKTFSTLPESSSTAPTYSNIKQFVAKGYVDSIRNSSLAREYDSTKAYKIGDYMSKSDTGSNPYLYIYRCKLNTSDPAGNYNSAYWDKVAYYEVDTLNLIPPKPIILELEGDLDSGAATPVEDATLIEALDQVKADFDLGVVRPVYLKRTNVTDYNGFMCCNGMVSSAQQDTTHNTYVVAFTEMYPNGVQWGYVIFQYLPLDEEDWGWHVTEYLY